MSNVWIIVADDMSAASVAGIAAKAGAPVDAIVFGDEQRAQTVATYGVASVVRFGAAGDVVETYAGAVAERAAQIAIGKKFM